MKKFNNAVHKINLKIYTWVIDIKIFYIRFQIVFIKFIRKTELLPISLKLKLLNTQWLKKENTDTKIENI
jgi:hypothetical protein